MDCMHVAQNWDELQVLDDLVTDVWCHKWWEMSWPAESLSDYQERIQPHHYPILRSAKGIKLSSWHCVIESQIIQYFLISLMVVIYEYGTMWVEFIIFIYCVESYINYEPPFSLFISCNRTVLIWKFYTQCALFGSTWGMNFI